MSMNTDSANSEKAVVLLQSEPPVRYGETLRDLVATVFRRRKVLGYCFGCILLGSLLAAILMPRLYESEAKIVVTHERLDTILTPGTPPQEIGRGSVSVEELNSEVELMQSEDLLRQVVLDVGLVKATNGKPPNQLQIAEAMRKLRSSLKVEPRTKSNVISVVYSSSSADRSARVVSALVNAYLEKHVEIHRLSDQLAFFDQQVDQYRKQLEEAEAVLAAFSRDGGAVSPGAQREAMLQKQSEFNATLEQTRSGIAETKERIRNLEKQLSITPGRLTTQSKDADNPQLLQDLRGTLLRLQLQRTELLSKYQPSYRPVQEIQKKIAETEAAITATEKSPLKDRVTDVNPVYQWIQSELAKSKADLRSLEMRAASMTSIVERYNQDAKAMDEQQLHQQDLLRQQKTAEDNYLLYNRKREEARIASAMDQRRFLNVSVLQAATLPYLPKHSRLFFLLLGFLLALFVTVAVAFFLEHTDDTFRTPRQVEHFLQIPVLAAVPIDNHLRMMATIQSGPQHE